MSLFSDLIICHVAIEDNGYDAIVICQRANMN